MLMRLWDLMLHNWLKMKQSLFTIKSTMPIPILVYGDSFQLAKYGHHILSSNLDLASNNKAGLHQTFWNSLIEFLCTDLDGNLPSALNPLFVSKLYHYISTLFEGLSETANKGSIFHVEWKKQASIHQRHRWHCIVCSIECPIHIHKFIPPEVWKAFNVGINAWNIIAVLHSNGDRTTWLCRFSWRSFHIYFKVYQIWPVCYSCWINWRYSITCTHCNIISLEHDWIPWQAKSQRIDVDATTFHFLWQLFMIITIFSRRFELDGGPENLQKSIQIWRVFVLWSC